MKNKRKIESRVLELSGFFLSSSHPFNGYLYFTVTRSPSVCAMNSGAYKH